MSSVEFDAGHRLWLLRTPNSAYAFRLDAADRPRHVHWGAPLTLEQAAGIAPQPSPADSSFDEPGDERLELPADGGAFFGVAGLGVRFADGTQALEWTYAGHEVEDGELAVRLRDRHYPLEAELRYRAHDDVIERRLRLRHTGNDDPITLLRTDSAAWTMPHRAGARLTHTSGSWSAESGLLRENLPVGETTLTSRRGVSSHQANPWLMLDDGNATETGGEVWSTALAWSGSWRITVERSHTGRVTWTGGFGHEGVQWRLNPGEAWETPVFAGLYAADGFGGTSRRWHSYVREHVQPQPGESRPIVYNSWEATGWDVDEAGQLKLAALAAEVGAELFVMDDGWFGARTGDTAGLGDWTVNRRRFPDGLGPLAAEVHRLGMGFGVWVEPEMVNPDSDLYREHPDWVLSMAHRERTTLRNQLVLDFGRPEVAGWAYEWLHRLVGEHGVDYLKWDMNRAFTEAGRPGDDDPGRLWVDHVRAVYGVLDRLREAHPALRIQACSGGGGRADLGILARTDEVWASDNTDAADRVTIQHGYSQLLPAGTMAAWVTDSPNPLTGRAAPLEFRFHVAMAGVLGLGGDLTRWSAAELQTATGFVALYKEIRPIVQHGDAYRLADPAASPLSAVQYVLGDDVVVLFLRRPHDYGRPVVTPVLAGLDPDARFRDVDTGEVHHGAVLLNHGLGLGLPGSGYASRLIRLRREPRSR
ncbi:alpha-galactosidase [Amycolatopsis sp. NBC_01480]|uniref:alpha-galactosidase n=1 Tax=Amycolatopsis sp. NBC_01480 TaxID=2903562 RepID=UPI002E29D6FB|nr:alpha-galactosidase [Amycolatopsis sp. NBC_01480]